MHEVEARFVVFELICENKQLELRNHMKHRLTIDKLHYIIIQLRYIRFQTSFGENVLF